MNSSLLGDAFAHHIWATERLLEACADLTPDQLTTPVPGTYGSIIDTLRHLVSSDSWYLSFFRERAAPPNIDVWAYARATGRERGVQLPES